MSKKKIVLINIFNFFFFQWFFIRLISSDNFYCKSTSIIWIKGIIPLSGWWGSYRYIRFKK